MERFTVLLLRVDGVVAVFLLLSTFDLRVGVSVTLSERDPLVDLFTLERFATADGCSLLPEEVLLTSGL